MVSYLKATLFRSILAVLTAAIGTLAALPALADRAELPTDWNNSPAPTALYGGCLPGDSSLRSKHDMILGSNNTLQDVLAITVLDCHPYYESPYPWGNNIVACPNGSPYAYCYANGNDGAGNGILLGVLKRGQKTNHAVAACPGGQTKVGLLIRAGEDPRLISGIVTISCGSAAGSQAMTRVDCPDGPSPYAYCLGGRDGAGHAVTLGVVAANGPGDPYGLYGECSDPSYGIQDGFVSKIDLVKAVASSQLKVQAIDLVGCGAPMGVPATLQKGACGAWTNTLVANRYDYCIVGTDSKGNGVLAGVITTK
jgi:hypothetical protein